MVRLALFSMMVGVLSFGKIYEVDQLVKTFGPIEEGTLVVVDLDNTVMETAQTLGSPQWFDYLVASEMKRGKARRQAVSEAITLWEKVQLRSGVKPVEPATASLIRGLQDSGVVVMGLTARPSTLSDRTKYQLKTIGVDLNRRPILQKRLSMKFKRDTALYANGVVFAGPVLNKGGVLAAFFARTGKVPPKVVFVDDVRKNVKNVERSMSKIGIDFVGYRYGAADASVKAFDVEVADTQLQYFNGILSDDEVFQLRQAD